MKKVFIFALLLVATALHTTAQAMEECSAQFKPLYMQILVYNKVEKISPGNGLIQPLLQQELNKMKSDLQLTTQEKVHSLESGFMRCEMNLSEEEMLSINIEVESFLKMKNPLIKENEE